MVDSKDLKGGEWVLERELRTEVMEFKGDLKGIPISCSFSFIFSIVFVFVFGFHVVFVVIRGNGLESE